MNTTASSAGLLATMLALASGIARAEPRELTLSLQTRDARTAQVMINTQRILSDRIGVVVVDPWNFHWCKTATMRVDALIPRMNKALEAARALGMTVML